MKIWIPNEAMTLVKAVRATGHELRLVGGSVRDAIIGLTPKDFDFSTTMTPSEMLALNVPEFTIVPTGLDHGTVSFVHRESSDQFEITTLRVDSEHDGRHATVQFTTSFEQDAARRDFTMNAISYDPITDELFDYFDGVKDIMDRKIRFVGSAVDRVKEDYLRLLRMYRFSAQLWFTYEVDPAALKEANGLTQISGERIRDEMMKIFRSGQFNVVNTLYRMGSDGVLRFTGLMPDDFADLVRSTIDPYLILAGLLDYEQVDQLNDRWKFSNQEVNKIKVFRKALVSPITVENLSEQILHQELTLTDALEVAVVKGRSDVAFELNQIKIVRSPVTGADLINRGFVPGIKLGKTLKAIEKRFIESRFMMSKDDLLKDV